MPEQTIDWNVLVHYTSTLKQILLRNGITQAELARESGHDEAQISKWVHTGRQPSLRNIIRLEAALARILDQRSPYKTDRQDPDS